MRVPTSNLFQLQSLALSTQFANVFKSQQQLSTGKKLLNSSDDPVLASQVKAKQDYISQLKSYGDNATLAQGRTQLFSTTIQSAINSLTDIQATLKRAQNGTNGSAERVDYANKIQADLQNILNMANMTDANGEYVYSGSNTSAAPYILSGNNYIYQGSFEEVYMDVAPNTTSVYREVGYNVFSSSYTGNGSFSVTATSTNVGTAYATVGSVTNPGSYVPDTYTITFGTNASGQTVYEVVGASSGQVIPALPSTFPNQAPVYTPGSNGQDINFNGMTVNINGDAKAGDTFVIAPSTQQNVFNTVQNLVNQLKGSVSNAGVDKTQLSQASESIAQILNTFTSYQSTVGARTTNLNAEIQARQDTVVHQTVTLGNLEDADFPSVVSLYTQQTMGLQATQQAYMKLQDLITTLLRL